jgi:hypothetical protein
MKHIRQHVVQRKVIWANEIVRSNDHKICEKLPAKETVETPATSTCLSVGCLKLKTDLMSNKLLHTEADARYTHHMQVKLEYRYYYIGKGS